MMRKYILIVYFLFFFSGAAFPQFSISGKVVSKQKDVPVSFAVISIPASGLWATANDKGEFNIKNIKAGKIILSAQYLGYVKKEFNVVLNKDIKDLVLVLEEDNLTLDEVVVTAKKGSDLSTSFVIDRRALDHLQMLNVTDATSLLPGGKTNTDLHLAGSEQRFSVNGVSSEKGNALFGVAVEVDGSRLSTNALRGLDGTDTRNISSSNVESIEIVTGIPSVEHGDMTNGMVKINTRKGTSPYIVDLVTKPNTKQLALSKGLSLGSKAGVLNFNIEHTKSIANLASPYTTYNRNSLSLNYSNTFNKVNEKPLTLNFGVTGNIGGFDSKSDPDLFLNTYSRDKDNVLRSNISARWLMNKPWITSVEASGNLNYNDKISEISANKSTTSSVAAIHSLNQGYHVGQTYESNPNADIILIPRGFWYELNYIDNKIINYSGRIKANWSRQLGDISNNLMVGAEYSGSGNMGRGEYYGDLRYAPTWREYRYDQESYINNYAFYTEDKIDIPINRSLLQLIAGVRSDVTAINGSEYGTVSALSPRFNAKYTLWERAAQSMSDLSVKIGWGKTVKLPGFNALYAVPKYRDILTFAPGTTSDGATFYAYYTEPYTRIFNPDLKWQHNQQFEISVNATLSDHRITLIASRDRTSNPYISTTQYEPFYYKFTDQTNLESSTIPIANRIYTVNKETGIVTVTDKTGTKPTEQLGYLDQYLFNGNEMTTNGSPVTRNRLAWIIDFKQITAIRTSIRLDGNYYYYKGLEQTVTSYRPNASITMADGKNYKYIGFFVGGASSANGSITKSADMNLTLTTHIPAIRLILSARIEGWLYSSKRNLSQSGTGSRGFVLDSRDQYVPSAAQSDIYGGDRFVGVYPDYYVSLDNLNEKIPFGEKFLWAKDNDVALYNELAKMVVKTNTNYYFNENKFSAFYSANIGVTKEIGRFASISFNATNFNVNMAMVKSTERGASSSLYDSSIIPSLYYGASLRLKF